LFSNYAKFLKVAPKILVNVIRYIFESYDKLLPPFITPEYINFLPHIINFPQIDVLIHDYSYKQHIVACRNGRLVTIKNAFVLKTYQSDYFLWRQEYPMPCHCDGLDYIQIATNLSSVLRANFDNIRNDSKGNKTHKCELCDKILTENTKARVFLPCQRVDIFVSGFADANNNGIFPLWLCGNNIDTLQKGDTAYVVAYYDIHLNYSLVKDKYMASMNEYFIGYNVSKINHVVNQNYFADLITQFWQLEVKTQWDYINYEMRNYDYILHSWYCLKKCLSVFAGDLFPADFVNLKLALLLSIVLINRPNLHPVIEYHSVKKELLDCKIKDPNTLIDDCINVFIYTTDDEIIMRAILDVTQQLENFHIFPTIYDTNSLYELLLKVNGGILLIKDANRLKKNDLEIINRLLKRKEVYIDQKYGTIKINCAIWLMVSEPVNKVTTTKGGCRIMTMGDLWPYETKDCFDIVLDLSRGNNLNKGVMLHFDFNYCNIILEKMLQGYQEMKYPPLAQRSNLKTVVKSLSKNIPRVERENIEEITKNNNKNALFILKKFYIGSRKNKQISISALNSMRKIANASSILRSMANGVARMYSFGKNGEIYLEIIDAVIAVMFNEETSLNKSGSENVIFGAKVTRFLMNQDQNLDLVALDDEKFSYLEKSDKQFLGIYCDILDFISSVEDRSSYEH